MRVTLQNPLGRPITLDTAALSFSRARSLLPGGGQRGSIAGSLRRGRVRVLVVLVLVAWWLLFHMSPPLPPRYAAEWRLERLLPQHDRTLPFPEGAHGLFVRFDTPKGTGFNHLMQRVLLQHHVAVLGNRSYVFEPFVEDETPLPFVLQRWPWRSARIPLTALVGNVLNGFEGYYNTPRAVSNSYYSSVCPRRAQVVHTVRSDKNPDGDLVLEQNGPARIKQLQDLVRATDKSCLRFVGDVFDDAFFDSDAPTELIQELIESPVLKHFTFAPSVLAIVNRMMPEIAPEAAPYHLGDYFHASPRPHSNTHLKHILALHLRMGNGWEEACPNKSITFQPFAAFNKLPLLPGNENVPPPADMTEASRLGLYRAKCLPDFPAIIARARRMRRNHPLLRSIYILTDAPDAWAEEARHWLSSDAWDKVFVGKADVYSDWAEHEIGVAADMEIARRAGVFIGNGFSTTSSNIVLLRSRDGVHPDFTQFW